ncbi:Rab-GTPase-TBC domain [Pseudocohnilembus persalinus]|uniref:Rab-GTPase-TBC domain n=1 Tax=Pseudocohnilembus persalinus TaxID=266149 RepID=A0A0V0R7Z8_PSEPJ|nr:Rab-GTPase-TBC domain [Pseudocohnilembus persalinus]|eukprot:KRX10617.1 Rab-GTPase-TBC domain [Pseudocohnilembus persalinus]
MNDKDIRSVELNLPNQKVVKADALRTRGNIYDDQLRQNLELLLTYYCKKNSIDYKQGLNELAAPFVYFSKIDLGLDTIYNYFNTFMNRFIPNLHRDNSDFSSLQCHFQILNLLFKYHDPQLFEYLLANDITTDIYAVSWFMTLFANKLSIDLLYLFWEVYIIQDDQYLVFFIALGLLISRRDKILQGDPLFLPQVMSSITIDSFDDFKKIFKIAIEKKFETPVSFFTKIESMNLFSKDTRHLKHEIPLLEKMTTIPVYPMEILNQIYPDHIKCANLFCQKNINLLANIPGKSLLKQLKKLVQMAQKIKEVKSLQLNQIQFVKLDLRENMQGTGTLAQSSNIGVSQYSEKLSVQILQDYNYCNGKMHICFIVNEFNQDIFSLEQIKQQKMQNQQSINKQQNRKRSENSDYSDDYDYDDEDEEDIANEQNIVKMLAEDFQKSNFQKISILEGGFKECHDFLLSLNIQMTGHIKSKCQICNSVGKEEKTNSLFDFFANVFTFKENKQQGQLVKKSDIQRPSFKPGANKLQYYCDNNNKNQNYNSNNSESTQLNSINEQVSNINLYNQSSIKKNDISQNIHQINNSNGSKNQQIRNQLSPPLQPKSTQFNKQQQQQENKNVQQQQENLNISPFNQQKHQSVQQQNQQQPTLTQQVQQSNFSVKNYGFMKQLNSIDSKQNINNNNNLRDSNRNSNNDVNNNHQRQSSKHKNPQQNSVMQFGKQDNTSNFKINSPDKYWSNQLQKQRSPEKSDRIQVIANENNRNNDFRNYGEQQFVNQNQKQYMKYRKRGIMKSYRFSKEDFCHFFNCLIGRQFQYYTCNQQKDKIAQQYQDQNMPFRIQQKCKNYKRIVIVSQGKFD